MSSKRKRSNISQPDVDYKMNTWTLRCFAAMLCGTIIIWVLNACKIFIDNIIIVSEGLSIITAVCIATLIWGRFVDRKKVWVKYVLLFLATFVLTVGGVFLSYQAILISAFPLLIAAQYASKKVLAYTYIISAIGTFVSVMGSYYFGLCDANMLILTTEGTQYYMNQYLNGALQFDILNNNPWYALPIYFAVPRCMILLCMVPAIASISKNVMEYAEDAVHMKHLSEHDEMTGLYNKNKYMAMAENVYRNTDEVGVIFWDINNLKVVNDTMGHEHGDYLITTVAGMIREFTDKRRRAYRIGGDEFIMVIANPEEKELDDLVNKWNETMSRRSVFSKMEISVSMGTAQGRGKDLAQVQKIADEAMYQQKKQYHEASKQRTRIC